MTAALHYRIVRIDARSRVGTTINVTRAEHDFRKTLHPAAFTGRLGTHNVLTGSLVGPVMIRPLLSVFTAVVKNRSSNGDSAQVLRIRG